MSKVWKFLQYGGPMVLALLAGCSHMRGSRQPNCQPQPCDLAPVTVLPEGERGRIDLDLSRLPPFAALDEVLSRQRTAKLTYRPVATASCQCLAASTSSVGNLLEKKSRGCLDQAQGGVACPR
jgi:hypothetical protein